MQTSVSSRFAEIRVRVSANRDWTADIVVSASYDRHAVICRLAPVARGGASLFTAADRHSGDWNSTMNEWKYACRLFKNSHKAERHKTICAIKCIRTRNNDTLVYICILLECGILSVSLKDDGPTGLTTGRHNGPSSGPFGVMQGLQATGPPSRAPVYDDRAI